MNAQMLTLTCMHAVKEFAADANWLSACAVDMKSHG